MKKSCFVKLYLLIILVFISGLSSVYSQNYQKLINTRLAQERERNEWLPSDIDDWRISDQYVDKNLGITHVYIQQQFNHIQVFNAISVFLIKDNSIVYFKPGLIDHIQNKVNADRPVITHDAAVVFALKHLGKSENPQLKLISNDAVANIFNYESRTVSNQLIKVQLVYRAIENKLLLAWDVSVDLKGESHWWNVRVDALTGSFIDKNDFTVECRFDVNDDHSILNTIQLEGAGILGNAMPVAVPDYRVFPFPIEAPSFGNNALLPDPSNVLASPYGWHDVDGIAGEEFNITRGNNAYAYEDANNDNLPGYSPNGGSNLHFDFPYTAGVNPITNQNASLTNLFYANNRIHDVLHPLGFNEAAGSFQKNNYGNGGVGGDFVLAEGFDGAGTDNANFSTPPDGASGRMQMFLWTGNNATCTSLNVTSNAFNGTISGLTAAFSAITNLTDTIKLVSDGVGNVTDACSAITNVIAGKIALIDRGNCNFINKAVAAQNAGAVGVIIANNVSGSPQSMGGTPILSIPCISITQSDGNLLKSALIAGVVVATINTCLANQIDGSFDNGIIAHEYGHGVSNRLTGGPSQVSCLSNNEQGGEGWSDWLALMMTIEPGDSGAMARGIGTYAKGQSANGAGIRRFPYSTNMSINPQTYADVTGNTAVHAIGEIWCSAIWDMSWFLINDLGYNANPYNLTSGNTIAMHLVLEGMKLQPCQPGFLDARDAILMADQLLYNNAHRCRIWEAFARRGMGVNAVQGSSNSATDQLAGFALPAYCSPPTQVPIANFASDQSTIACGGAIKFTDQSIQAFNWLWDFGDQSTSTFQNPTHVFNSPGVYNVKLVVTNALGSDSIIRLITVTNTFTVNVTATPTTICNGDSVQLNAIATGSTYKTYSVSNIPFAPISGAGTLVSLGDEQMSSAKPIGFTFNFFGSDYTDFYLASNGFITFSAGMSNPFYSQVIPTIYSPNNFIALCWNDLNPGNGSSSINYFTTGAAPNRKLIINYNTAHYSGTIYPFVVQAILYETSNIVEIHTIVSSNAAAVDSASSTTQGLENSEGTDGVAIPGRNNSFFVATNDAFRFTPFIPYSYSWMPGSLIGASQTVNPATTGNYTVKVTDGTACVASFNTPVITVNTCTLSLNLNVLIEGFYSGVGFMQPVLNTNGLSSNVTHCDSITIELHNQFAPSTIFRTDKVLLGNDGHATVTYLASIIGNTYYIVVRHRNSIETWSKLPVTMSSVTNYDFIH